MPSHLTIFFPLLCLTGCAELHWEPAMYEGQRSTAEQCRLTRRDSAPPCATLPTYGQYEKERTSVSRAAKAQPPEGMQR